MTRATATAPSNIAFVKYWGATDLGRAVPKNPSISMTLSAATTTTTVAIREEDGEDRIRLAEGGRLLSPPESFGRRVLEHLRALREAADLRGGHIDVVTRNAFPSDAGLASSASGFAALAVAFAAAAGRNPGTEELARWARLGGSGSATRSVLGGFVEWPARGAKDDLAPAALAPFTHWDLRDVIAIVQKGPKAVSSLEGHRRAATSPHFLRRQELLPARLDAVREAIAARDFDRLAPVLEEEAIELHLIAMSSRPPIFYWNGGTLAVLEAVRALRRSGVAAAATMDAGANVHVICPATAENAVSEALARVPGVLELLRDRVGPGPRPSEEHLL